MKRVVAPRDGLPHESNTVISLCQTFAAYLYDEPGWQPKLGCVSRGKSLPHRLPDPARVCFHHLRGLALAVSICFRIVFNLPRNPGCGLLSARPVFPASRALSHAFCDW